MPDTESNDLNVIDEALGRKTVPGKEALLDASGVFNPVTQVSRDLSIGEQQVQNNQHNLHLMSQDMDDSKRLNMIHAGVTKIQQGMSQSDQEAEPWYQQLAHNVTQSVPQMIDMGKQGVAGGAVGAAGGAVVGSAIPGAGTVAGAGTGWGWGLTTGMFKSGFEQATGEMYGQLREGGVDHDTAKNIAYAVGTVNGALNTVGGKVLTSIAGKAVTQAERGLIIKAATSSFVKQLEKNMAGRAAMNITAATVEQTAIGTGTSIMNQAGLVASGILQKHNPEAFTDWASASKAVSEAFISSLMAGAVTSAAAHGAGQAAGSAIGKAKLALTRPDLESLKGITPQQMLEKVAGHVEDLPNPWETEESSVEHDEKGKVYIRTGTGKTQATPLSIEEIQNGAHENRLNDIESSTTTLRHDFLDKINPEQGRHYQGHGMSGSLQKVKDLIDKGIDPDRDFFTGPMYQQKMTYGVGVRDNSPFILVGAKDKPLGAADPPKYLVVDDNHAPFISDIQKTIPQVKVLNKEEAIKLFNGETSEVSTSKNQKTKQLQMTGVTDNAQSKINEGLSAIYPEERTISSEKTTGDKQLRLALRMDERHLNPIEVKGRLNKLASDIKTLKKEERRLEAEITVKEGTGQDSHQLINRWRKVGQAIDALEGKRDLIEQGLGTNVSEGSKDIQLKMKTLNKVFDNLTATAERLQRTKEKAAASEEVGFKRGKFQTEREIKKIQAGLINVVNETTEDRTIRANVKQYVNKVTNGKQALIAIETIKANVNKQEGVKAAKLNEADRVKTYNAVVKMVEGGRVKLQSGHPTAQLPAELVNKLQTLKGFLKDKKTLSSFLEQTALDYGDKTVGEVPADVAFKLELANMASALHNGDALTRNVTAANIAQWVYDGEKVIATKKAELQAVKDLTITTAKNSLGVKPGQVKYVTSQVDQIRHSINDIGAQGFTWNTLLDLLTPKDKNHSLSKILDESESRHNYLKAAKDTNLKMTAAIQDHMQANGFKGNLIQKVWNDNNTHVEITSANKEGNLRTDKMTRGQMLDVALKFRDESLHPALREGNGFTLPGDVEPGTSTIERINEALTKDDHAQLDATALFYQDYHPSINEVYRNKYGADLPMRENYSPVTRKGYKVDAPYSQQGLQFSNLLPGSANTRLDSKLPLQFHNPMEDLVSHVKQWEYFKNYTDLLDRTGHVLTDTDIRTHIREQYGAGTLKVLDDFHERFIKNTPVPSAPGNGWWSAMRSDFSNTVMGFRANQFFTILPHGLNTWADYSPGDILHGIAQTILHPIETDKVLKQSPVFEGRTREGTNFELETAMNHSGLFANTIGKIFGVEPTLEDSKANSAIKRYMYAAHIGADVGIQRIFGAPIYHAGIKKGLSPHQALIATERAIEQTQPGHSVSQTPFIQTNPIAHTMLAQYTQHPSQVLGKSLVAVRDWQHNLNSPKAWMDLGGKLGALWVVPGALTAAARVAPLLIANPTQEEDSTVFEDQAKESVYGVLGGAAMGPLESEPIIGDIVQSIWFHAAKPLIGVDESQMGGMSRGNFVSEIYDNTKTALKRWEKLGEPQDPTKLPDLAKEEEDTYKAQLATAKAGSMAVGIPSHLTTGPLSAAHQAGNNDIVGAAFALGAWSPSMLAKRIPRSTEDQVKGFINKETKRIKDSIKGVQDESVYDTMSSYLEGLFHGEKPPKNTNETSPEVKAFMEEVSK